MRHLLEADDAKLMWQIESLLRQPQASIGRVYWHALTTGKWIKGLLAQEGAERRVYVVTLTPVLAETPYERWPCIQSG